MHSRTVLIKQKVCLDSCQQHIFNTPYAVSSGVVSLDAAESALNTLLVVSTENEFKPIQVFNAFDSPQLYLNEASHTYELRDGLNRKLHGTAQDRLQVLRNR